MAKEWIVPDADLGCDGAYFDYQELVRCRECKHSEPWYWDRSRCFLWVEDGISVFNDGFCSYGERKEGAD